MSGEGRMEEEEKERSNKGRKRRKISNVKEEIWQTEEGSLNEV